MFTSIVLALDLEATGDRALPIAASLARLGGLDVELVTVSSPHMPPDVDEYELEQRASAHALERYSTTVLHNDYVGAALVEHMTSRPEALLVMGTSAKGSLSAWFLGSTTEHVLSHVHAPVLVAGPHVTDCHLARPTLIACVGESDHTAVTVPAIESWVRTFDTRLTWITHIREAPVSDPRGPEEKRACEHVETLSEQLHQEGIKALTRIIHDGDPVTGLEEFALLTVDSVLVAVSARWTDPHRHARSVTRRLVRHSTRPVLVVPAEVSQRVTSAGTDAERRDHRGA